MGKKTVAIFDFCETLISFQTADRFVDFVAEKNLRNNLIDKLCSVVSKIPFVSRVHKELKLLKIKGLSESKLRKLADEYVDQVLKPAVIDITMERIKFHKSQNHLLVIASGGYDIYLENFAAKFGFDVVVGTNIDIVTCRATGRIKGLDCLNGSKVVKLKDAIVLENYDLDASYCYSDSLSDMPIFNLVGHRIFVINENGQAYHKIIDS